MDRRDFLKKTALAATATAITAPVSAMMARAESAELLGDETDAALNAPQQEPLRVLMVNGSPRPDGNTFCCLKEIEAQLAKHSVASEIIQIGRRPVRMCINCGGCRQSNSEGCVFDDDACAEIIRKMASADALIVGTPVYYGQPNGGVLSLMQRLFFSAGHLVQNKPAAALAVCRRGGATATLQTMNMMFEMMNMPVVTSQYWNIAYGLTPGQVIQDQEGMQTMRTLGRNMAWMIRQLNVSEEGHPELERPLRTNFIK